VNHVTVSTPDQHGEGLLQTAIDPLRYDGHTDDPGEVAGILRRCMPSNVKVLDVGCGTGSVTQIVNRDKNNDVYGIEPDAARASIASSRGIRASREYLTKEFFDVNGTFDVVVFADVLEHLASPAELLSLAASGLRPNGCILISVPNVAHWSVRLALLLGRFNYAPTGIMDSTHLRWFTERTIISLCRSCELQIKSISQTAGADLPVYGRKPFAWLPGQLKRRIVRGGTRMFPRLIGCQHIVVATKTL
jgi:methionine biosynthesis protein MetW